MGAVLRRVAPTPWSLLIFQGHRRCLAADSVIGLEPVGESPLPGAHRVGGGDVAIPAVLPHHRTYGSVSGGS